MAQRYWVVHTETDEDMVGMHFESEERARAVAIALNTVSRAGGMGEPYGVK